MDTKVQALIACLIRMKENQASLVSTITDLDLVIEGLNELDQMIEMDNVKLSIIEQIKFLLVNSVNMQEKNFDGHMVHTVLSGGPGLGKTATGCILAKIWTGLGLIKPTPISEPPPVEAKDEKEDQIMILEKQINNLNSSGKVKNGVIKKLQSYVADIKNNIKKTESDFNLIQYRLKSLLRELKKSENKNYSSICMTEELINSYPEVREKLNKIVSNTIPDEYITFTLPIPSSSSSSSTSSSSSSTLTPEQKLDQAINDLVDLSKNLNQEPEKKDEIEPRKFDEIRIVSREDFVGGFLGQTAIKTEKLLRDSFGKILFIDEAYSLVNDEKDSFGREALTVLNRFMSEYSDRIIIIFAGYKDLMEETIFKYQPGLKRRCSWNFEIKGYTENGLAKIFEKQLNSNGWKLSEEFDIVSFFKNNMKDFPHYGGSTLQLAFYCKLLYSSLFFDYKRENNMIIDQEILENALEYLRKNRISDGEEINLHHHHMYL